MVDPTLFQDRGFSITTVPPSRIQQRIALALIAALVLAFILTAPLADIPLPPVASFITVIQAILLVSNLITAFLLFGHFSAEGDRAVLVLGSGYLLSALTTTLYALAFPGAISPTHAVGSLQTAVWLYIFWHIGFSLSVALYALLKTQDFKADETVGGSESDIAIFVGLTVGLALVIGTAALRADIILPTLAQDALHGTPAVRYWAALCALTSGLALALLWWRRRTVLDIWLLVAMTAIVIEPILAGVLSTNRFSLGFYASRAYSVVTSTVVLVILLSEMVVLHARLAKVTALLQRERRSGIVTIDAVAASITHEIRQPLAAIAANGEAALMLMDRNPPDIPEVRAAVDAVVKSSFSAAQLLNSLRALFRADSHSSELVDLNAMVCSVLHLFDDRFRQGRISVAIDLAPQLPLLSGHKGQLQEVVYNLLSNAVDGMVQRDLAERVLAIETRTIDLHSIRVTFADSGIGISPHQQMSIFDPFVTTKPHGLGLGLAICRMIVERHGGQIAARSAPGAGATFTVTLPIHHKACG